MTKSLKIKFQRRGRRTEPLGYLFANFFLYSADSKCTRIFRSSKKIPHHPIQVSRHPGSVNATIGYHKDLPFRQHLSQNRTIAPQSTQPILNKYAADSPPSDSTRLKKWKKDWWVCNTAPDAILG